MAEDLSKYRDSQVYDLDHGWYEQTREEMREWLVWNPPKGDAPHDKVQVLKMIEQEGYLRPWTAFKKEAGFQEEFVPSHFYDAPSDWPEDVFTEVNFGIGEEEPISEKDSVPAAKIPVIKSVRDEARNRLEEHSAALGEKVMRPVRRVLIPCVIEAARQQVGFQPILTGAEQAKRKLFRVARRWDQLWENAIKRGVPFDTIQSKWYEIFQRVPDPVATGAKDGFSLYLEKVDDHPFDWSRDRILERARPVYRKWFLTRRMVLSALHGWRLGEVADKINQSPEKAAKDIFQERSRPEGSKTHFDEEVKNWAIHAFERFLRSKEGVEAAKDRVIEIAEDHDYHFSRRSLERWQKDE